MSSRYEAFFEHGSYAVIGHESKKNFPVLTYQGLKKMGKTVYPVDSSAQKIEGDRAYADLASLPDKVDAAILEVPKDETAAWVGQAARAGIRDVWIHMGRETPEALALAKEQGLDVRSGTCAVMYVTKGFTYHTLHKGIMKLIGKY